MERFSTRFPCLWLLPIFLTYAHTNLSAQNCEGEVGTQIFFEDFGSGEGPGPSLPSGTTTYNYGSIGGGNYVVTNTTGLNGSLWHNAPDHTPDDNNGYCLLFDASSASGIFYTRLFEDLCPNTNYTFSCYVANVVHPTACGGNSIEPDLKFSLLDPITMAELGSVTTGGIATTDDISWNQYSISFTTNNNQQAVLIEITNNASGGCGNDLAIDDFSFATCNPVLYQEFDLCTLTGNMIQVGTEVYSSPGEYETIIDLPNACHDSIVYTTLIGNALVNTDEYITFCPDDSVSINGVFYNSDTIVIDTLSPLEECLEIITYFVEETSTTTTEQVYLCEEDSLFISGAWVSESGIYQDTFISIQGCDSIHITDLQNLEYAVNVNNPVVTLAPGETIELLVTSNPIETADYQWLPSELFSCPTCEDPILSPTQSGIYSVTGYDPVSGCTDTLEFNVEVEPCDGSYFPNVFSPNYDGVNDYFQPFLSNCVVNILTFQIFDRWGNVIHIQNNIPVEDARWDGRIRSKDAAVSVYTFFLKTQIFDGSSKIYNGNVTLVR